MSKIQKNSNVLKKTGDDEEGSEEEELQTTAGVTADDLENAEEVLEIARSIYTESPEHKLELAEVYATMGDVSLEVGNETMFFCSISPNTKKKKIWNKPFEIIHNVCKSEKVFWQQMIEELPMHILFNYFKNSKCFSLTVSLIIFSLLPLNTIIMSIKPLLTIQWRSSYLIPNSKIVMMKKKRKN